MVRHPARPVAALVAVVLALAGCGGDDDDGPTTSDAATDTASDTVTDASNATTDGGWSYVDGSGTETVLDEVPVRIVAHGSAASALIPLGIRPVGIYADAAVEEDLGLRDLDLTGIEIVGEEWGVINLEAVAALQPDLIISEWWPVEEAYSGLEAETGGANEQLRELAPVVGVAQGPSIVTMIEDYEALAASLGADLDAADVAASRTRFDAAVERFRAAVSAQPGLTALAISPTPESLYVAVPEHAAELCDLVGFGLDVVVPDEPDPGFEYWQTLSWEQADRYQADLLLIDERGYPENLAEAERAPTWSTLRAAAAGAVAVWPAYWLRNYDDYAAALEQLADAVEAADADLVA
jgi:iron complex transport system substrate-binding protein